MGDFPAFVKLCEDTADPDKLSGAMYPETVQAYRKEINHAKERMVCGFAIQVSHPDYVRYALKARDGKLNKDHKPFIKWDDFKSSCTDSQWYGIIEETYD